jgi:hypothetical protein
VTTSITKTWEAAKLEYEQALSQYQNCTILRRQDMAFVTTVQAAVLTIIGPRLPHLDLGSLLLSLIACFLLLLGINGERRLSSYMDAYSKKAQQIEEEFGLSLVMSGLSKTRNKKLLFSNATMFPLYYTFCIFGL